MRDGGAMTRVRELGTLRFLAITAAMVHYYRSNTLSAWPLAYGWAGVDLFFGISGFLITTILLGLRGIALGTQMMVTH
jgi:peptidoglycan/LPS O-acetylase OafA/YrhL